MSTTVSDSAWTAERKDWATGWRVPNGAEWWIDLQADPEGNGPGYANVERAVPAGGVR